MPVDDLRADFLVVVDPVANQLTWFEINAGSGALRRLAGKPADVGEAVGGLCTHYDAASQRHRVLVVTRSGELQDWTAVAYAGKQPNFANRIEARLEGRFTLDGAGGDCAADPATGDVYVIVDARELRRVVSDRSSPSKPLARSGESFQLEGVVETVDVVRGAGGSTTLLTVDRAGRRLAALDASGRLLASLQLDTAVTVLGSGGELVAIVTDEGELRLGTWSRVSKALGLRDAPHRGSATQP
jgi:myo-inositol-hexaphosphate 3-phosphohydrolase